MGIVILAIVFFFFEKRIKQNGSKALLVINGALIAYVVFSIILNDYLQYVYQWDNGVPGADLSAHFDGARALAEGIKIPDLNKVAYRFSMSLSGITYIAYAILVRIISFSPVVISYRFSLHLLYTIQIMIALLGIDNLCRLFPSEKGKYNYSLFFAAVSCVCIAQQACILMRDIWVFFFITLLFSNPIENRRNKIWAVILVIVCALLRFYTVLLTIPFFVWKYKSSVRLGVLASIAIMVFFSVGQGIIREFAVWFGIKWEFGFNYDIRSIIVYIMFPNIFSQTHNVQHMITGYHANFGGNTEWIYYMLACWNCFIYPIAGYGMYKVFTNTKTQREGIIWLSQIVNIGLLYSVFYNSVSEPRHKLLILFGLLFFFNKGVCGMKPLYRIIFSSAVVEFLLCLLLVVK